ncbi:MAG: pirin family protein [Pseudomonadota bacterium]
MNSMVRRAEDRGTADFGWLDSKHSFSFGRYYDPDQMGFGVLRVINEDRVAPGRGFDEHPHQNMEILSYVIEGSLSHQDSMGNGSIIRPGDLQRMSAGTGVIHSEYNADNDKPVHFLQIWIVPEKSGIEPGYEQKHFPIEQRSGRLALIASRSGRSGSVSLAQDVDIYAAMLTAGDQLSQKLQSDRSAWVQAIRGSVEVDGTTLDAGDGLAIRSGSSIELETSGEAEILLFDVPKVE